MTDREEFEAFLRQRVHLQLPASELARQAWQAARRVDVDELAQLIRKVDGRNDMGAGRLAEYICEWLSPDPPEDE